MQGWGRRALCIAIAAIGLVAAAGQRCAQSASDEPKPPVRVGLILDMSGPYSDVTGSRNVLAARMAVEDFGGKVLGTPVEVVSADHHGDPDRALSIARDWFDEQHVDAIVDVAGSSEAVLVQRFGDVRHKIVIINSAGAVRLTNEACTPTAIHYTYDTRAIANTVGRALLARGADTWFFITVDYSFGYDLERDTEAVIKSHGGKLLGDARHPLGARDFEAYLARARDSKAKVVGLANAGADLDATVRQAARLGMLPGKQIFAGLAMRINAVNSIGLATTQGMMLGESFYWDADDATRAWSARFFERAKEMPNSLQAGIYSATTHYLQAIAQAGSTETDPVMRTMRDTPINDFFAHNGRIRADGVMVHDMHLFQVKTPAESLHPWDYLKDVATVAGEEAFGPISQSKCPLAKQ